MTIEEIADRLNALNAATPAAKKVKKPVEKTNGHTVLTADEQLRITVQRIVAALDLASQGVTADVLVEKIREYETPYEGTVQ
jgi:hypothetical protein